MINLNMLKHMKRIINRFIREEISIARIHELYSSAILSHYVKVRGNLENIFIGEGTIVQDEVEIVNSGLGSICIGSNCIILSGAKILSYGGVVKIGNSCSLNPYSIIYGGEGGIVIGNYVRIAAHCVLIPQNHNFERLDKPIFEQGVSSIGIVIDDDVWIGANVTILDNVHIGMGSVIGAGSVVTKNIPAFSLVVGNPGRVIRTRN